MYTVLLVDDEEDVQKKLINAIDWSVYGINNLLTACDGVSACGVLRENHVDLLITDIRMPNMDGLSLLRHVREAYPHIRCMLLTSYSEFQYAVEAISLGVEDYLLKPLNTLELENSVRKSIDNLSAQKQIMNTLFLENILSRWVNNDISSDELSERAKHVHINIYFGNYCVVILHSSSGRAAGQILARVYAAMQAFYGIYHFVNNDGWHVLIFGGHKISRQHIADAFQSAQRELPQADLHICVGNVVDSFEEVHQSFQSARDCVYSTSPTSGQCVFYARKLHSENQSNYHINTIIEHLRSGTDILESSDTQRIFDEIFSDIGGYSIDELNGFIDSLVIRLSLQLSALGLIDPEEREKIISNIYHYEEAPGSRELLAWFGSILSLCRALILKHTNQLSPSILLAMQYISDNYAEYASIKDFCNRYKMNASYLGLLFKKETGIYFKDYINQIRISRAISLIRTTNLKSSDICKQVGFSYTSYFIACFKNQTGLSPTQYKQMLNKKKAK